MQLLIVASTSSLLCLSVLHVFNPHKVSLWQAFIHKPWLYILLGNINPIVYYLVLFASYDLLPEQIAQSINYTWGIMLAL